MRKPTKKSLNATEKLLENNSLEDSVLSIFPNALVDNKSSTNRVEFILPMADEDLFPQLQKIFNTNKASFQLVEKNEDRQIRVILVKT